MTGSSPADLAVTFRSIDRRLREAREAREGGDGGDEAFAVPLAELRAVVAAAAAELDVDVVGADLAAQCAAIASAIERVPAKEWDGARLDRLRSLGLDAGRLLRSIADLAREQ